MRYAIEFTGSAARELRRAHAVARRRLTSRIDALAADPRPRGVKPLKGPLKGLWRVRVGDYRIIYEIDDAARAVTISAIARHHVPFCGPVTAQEREYGRRAGLESSVASGASRPIVGARSRPAPVHGHLARSVSRRRSSTATIAAVQALRTSQARGPS